MDKNNKPPYPPRPDEKTPAQIHAERRLAERKRRQKARFSMFMAIVVFVSVILCVSAFALVFNSFSESAAPTATPTARPVFTPLPPDRDDKTEIKSVYLVKSVAYDTKELVLYDVENSTEHTLTAAGTTVMKDKYGNTLVLAEFKPGDVVDASFLEGEKTLISLRQSALAKTYTGAVGAVVESGNIQLGNDTFAYNEHLVCLYNGKPFDINKIDKFDTINLRVYKSAALYVELTQGHGNLQLLHNEHIMNGTLELGNSVYSKLTEDSEFRVTEGTHRVIVKGSNIETYIREIVIISGETITVDLSEVQIKAGIMTFSANTDDINLTVNGTRVELSAMPVYDYGEYVIRAVKDGYEPFEITVLFDIPVMDVLIELIPLPEPTPTPTPDPTPKPTSKPEMAKIKIFTVPAGASIYVDGFFAGISPIVSLTLEHGEHVFTAMLEGYLETVYPIFITGDREITLTLQPLTSILIP